jgi:hypothetical protein
MQFSFRGVPPGGGKPAGERGPFEEMLVTSMESLARARSRASYAAKGSLFGGIFMYFLLLVFMYLNSIWKFFFRAHCVRAFVYLNRSKACYEYIVLNLNNLGIVSVPLCI